MTLGYVERAEGKVAYEQYGDDTREVVYVLVPGIGDLRSTWRIVARELASLGHRVLAMDLRGHGDSDATFSSYSARDIGDDVVALIEQQDLKRVVVVGNSIGGGAACHVAHTMSDRVERLVLINPFVRDMPADRWMRPVVPILFASLWGVWVWLKYRTMLFKVRPTDFDSQEQALGKNLKEKGRLDAIKAMMRASKSDIAENLSTLKTPTLLIMGGKDPDYPDPIAESNDLCKLLGGPVEVNMIQNVGHYPQLEAPQEVLTSIRNWYGIDA